MKAADIVQILVAELVQAARLLGEMRYDSVIASNKHHNAAAELVQARQQLAAAEKELEQQRTRAEAAEAELTELRKAREVADGC